MAYRSDDGRFCTSERFAAYQSALRPRFCARMLPASSAHPARPPFFQRVVGCAHSVVTAHLIDADGEPTSRARDEIIAFFVERLRAQRGER